MTTAGVPYKEAAQYAGPTPVIIGIGIATPNEKSKMPIHQRSRKRAEADAIKQRYDVSLRNTTFTADEPEVIEAEFEDDNGREPRDEETIKAELGFDDVPEEVIETKSSKMSLESASEVTNRDGVKYGELDTEKLAHMANALTGSLKGDLNDEDRITQEYKLDAIAVILASR